MNYNSKFWLVVASVLFLMVFCFGVTLAGNALGWFVNNTADFVIEQQPGAKSVGDLIGKQYSQLRALSVQLDNIACKVEINDRGQRNLFDVYGDDVKEWPDQSIEQLNNLLWEQDTILQAYSSVAAEYNNLRTDLRTIADNLGLEVDDIPEAEALSPLPGMCNGFALPELE